MPTSFLTERLDTAIERLRKQSQQLRNDSERLCYYSRTMRNECRRISRDVQRLYEHGIFTR